MLSSLSNNLLCISDELNFWSSKFTVKDGDQSIDISFAATWGSSSTVPIGATAHQFCYPGTVYHFDSNLLNKHDASSNEIDFDVEDAEEKLYSFMKSPKTNDGCTLKSQRPNKIVTCNRKRTWTLICSHGLSRRKIDDCHFGPDSVGKLDLSFQTAKRTKSKGSAVKGIFVQIL